MLYISDPANIVGVDPNEASIAACRDDRLLGTIEQSEYLPETLPVHDRSFDLIYAYSVFTHLSDRATGAALAALRRYIRSDGLLAITIRPVDYWRYAEIDPSVRENLRICHRINRFAFLPHNRLPIDGDVTYGDTSMQISWITERFPEWHYRGSDRGLDPLQTILFLSPG